jgi:hypothetical protein
MGFFILPQKKQKKYAGKLFVINTNDVQGPHLSTLKLRVSPGIQRPEMWALQLKISVQRPDFQT